MEEQFRFVASYVALALETLVVLIVAWGALETVFAVIRHVTSPTRTHRSGRHLWLRFAGWILLALEFALGADIIRTAIAPTWEDIGKLGAIALIRTFLGFFLGKDMETIGEPEKAQTSTDA